MYSLYKLGSKVKLPQYKISTRGIAFCGYLIALLLVPNYLTSAFAPAASSSSTIFLASSAETPSLTALGAPSTRSFASLRPSPVIPLTTLITPTFEAPASVRITSNSVFSSAIEFATRGYSQNTARTRQGQKNC